jgi:hypothetical protein
MPMGRMHVHFIMERIDYPWMAWYPQVYLEVMITPEAISINP